MVFFSKWHYFIKTLLFIHLIHTKRTLVSWLFCVYWIPWPKSIYFKQLNHSARIINVFEMYKIRFLLWYSLYGGKYWLLAKISIQRWEKYPVYWKCLIMVFTIVTLQFFLIVTVQNAAMKFMQQHNNEKIIIIISHDSTVSMFRICKHKTIVCHILLKKIIK